MKSIGIKLADGTFYPLLEEGNPEKRTLDLTTVMDNQTKVQVEVYRTESGSLEDAEYIDTLEIKNLRPHENGEPTLCLAIDVDENNELSAEIRDPETGKKSEIQVTLQSRTLAEQKNNSLEEEDVTISDNDLEKAGLNDFVEKKEFDSKEIPLPSEDFSFDDVNESTHEINDEQTDYDDNSTITEEPKESESKIQDTVIEESFDLPEIEETKINDDDIFNESSTKEDENFSTELSNFDDSIFDETNTEKTIEENETINDQTLPEINDSLFDEPEEEKTLMGEETSIDTLEDDLDLPDFDDLEATTINNSPVLNDELLAANKTEEDYTLPDFDSEESLTDSSEDFTLPPDFDVQDKGEDNLNFDDQPKNPTFAPSTSMFSNLYDKETLEGTSGTYDFNDNDKKSKNVKIPMIICIICAIICIIAVLLTLFVIPSKLNIFDKDKTNNEIVAEFLEEEQEETIDNESKEDIPVEEIAPAKEDTIVIAETPEAVIPAEPEPSTETIPDIRYKIVWGDTLWDISTAYYKTPWKYKQLAKYNRIKNPDHIISGTYILIPAE